MTEDKDETFRCCNEDFKDIAGYIEHRLQAHQTAAEKKCRVCTAITDDFAKFQRTCRDCMKHEFQRCTKCNEVKHKSDFYKGVAYGKCAECRSSKGAEYKPRAKIFESLPDNVLEDIYQRLEERRIFQVTDGADGEKYSYVSIASRHGIKASNFHAWLRAGKLHPWFRRNPGSETSCSASSSDSE